MEISRGAIATNRERISGTVEQPMQEALAFARLEPVAYVDETGAATSNAVNAVFREAMVNDPRESGIDRWPWSPPW